MPDAQSTGASDLTSQYYLDVAANLYISHSQTDKLIGQGIYCCLEEDQGDHITILKSL